MAEKEKQLIQEPFRNLSNQLRKVVVCISDLESPLNIRAKCSLKSFGLKTRFKMVFRAMRTLRAIPRKSSSPRKFWCDFSSIKLLTLWGFVDIAETRDAFQELKKAVKDAYEMAKGVESRTRDTLILGTLKLLWLLNDDTIAAESRIARKAQQEYTNFIELSYIVEVLKGFQFHKNELKFLVYILDQTAKLSSISSKEQTDEGKKLKHDLSSLSSWLKVLTSHIWEYKLPTGLCKDYIAIGRLYVLAYLINKVQILAKSVHSQTKEQPSFGMVKEIILMTETMSRHIPFGESNWFKEAVDDWEDEKVICFVNDIFSEAKQIRHQRLDFLISELDMALADLEAKQETNTDELDKTDNEIIKIYQEAEKQAKDNPKGKIKLPGSRKIANALFKSGITSKIYSHTAIDKRRQKLRDMGLIGLPDDGRDTAKRCTHKHIDDMEGDGEVKRKF